MITVAMILLFVWAYLVLTLIYGLLRVRSLKDAVWSENLNWPRVSVLIPARNEEASIRPALSSVLQLDYPNLEIIAVNDRSDDATGAILKEGSHEDSRLKIEEIFELPQGWLGKCYALHKAQEKARGEYLLFTDADVQFEKTSLKRAVYIMQTSSLDHLVALPKVMIGGVLEKACVTLFQFLFLSKYKCWKAKNKKSKAYVGIGAFNMVSRKAYDSIGGHQSLRMATLDDLLLGKKIKEAGFPQEMVSGIDFIRVPWSKGFRDFIHILMKNAFAGFHFKIVPMLFLSALLLAFIWIPWIGMFMNGEIVKILSALSLGFAFLLGFMFWIGGKISPWIVFLWPLASVILVYVFFRSAWITLRNNGITWRGTYYKLENLQK